MAETKKSKVVIAIKIEEGKTNTTTGWADAKATDLALAVSQLELTKLRILNLLDTLSKKSFLGKK